MYTPQFFLFGLTLSCLAGWVTANPIAYDVVVNTSSISGTSGSVGFQFQSRTAGNASRVAADPEFCERWVSCGQPIADRGRQWSVASGAYVRQRDGIQRLLRGIQVRLNPFIQSEPLWPCTQLARRYIDVG